VTAGTGPDREERVDIIVKAKCEVPTRVKEDVVDRLAHATRFFDKLIGIEVVFAAEQNPRIAEPARVEVTARTKGHHIRAEGWAADHRGAVDVAIVRFERQLARYKSRMVNRARGRGVRPEVTGMPPGSAAGTDHRAEAGESAPPIVRTKEFTLSPMLPEDAAIQLELLGHEFFVFTNVLTRRCNIVYRRKEGDFGLIETIDETP